MHKKDEAKGIVLYKVTSADLYDQRLRAYGFALDGMRQFWWIEVPIVDLEGLRRIEQFLKAAERLDKRDASWRKVGR